MTIMETSKEPTGWRDLGKLVDSQDPRVGKITDTATAITRILNTAPAGSRPVDVLDVMDLMHQRGYPELTVDTEAVYILSGIAEAHANSLGVNSTANRTTNRGES